MKHMKRMMALMLAFVLCLSMSGMAAFADETPAAQPESGEFNKGTFSQTAETTISATGLTAGDTVEVYQLVKWDATTSDWALNGTCGVTLDELVNGITEAEATTIRSSVSNGAITTLTANADGEVSYDCTNNPGLFYLKAIPAANNKDTVYNPAFVSADYYAGGNTVSFSDKIGSSAVVKKSNVPFDKDVDGTEKYIDTKPGDVIPYVINTTIPSYGTSFTNPKFEINDVLSAGLELQDTITVKYGNTSTTTSNADVTITPNGKTGFKVAFSKDYLTGLNGATPAVEIKYSAKVTTEALENVTYMDNKATLTFSDTPTTTKDKDDITRHYTFSIDANMNGGNQGGKKTRELIKIGVDEKGQTITDFTAWEDVEKWTNYTPLAGATFELVGNGKTYTATSTAEGYISFHGLDAGTYTLTETAAPAGYVKDTKAHTVVITPAYDTEKPDVLVSYEITVDGSKSSYTITNMKDDDATVETTVDMTGSMTFPFVNTKGTELPSTGGMGTTMFYVVGSALVIGAAVLLISKRRMAR